MDTDFQIGIIGAGFGGISTALKLKKTGNNSFVILERAAEAGGVWRDNIYPGCRCDIAAPVYSFFDEPNPDWESLYATQSELYTYINHVIDKNDIRKHIRFNQKINDATFVAESGSWRLTNTNSQTTTVKVLVVAPGTINRPNIPPFKGIDTYHGKIIHSSKWEPAYPLQDKRIAIIGTGASAVQIIPSIAGIVRHLTVFQRSAAWIVPRNNIGYSAADQIKFRNYPVLMRITRFFHYWKNELLGIAFVGPQWINKLFQRIFINNLSKAIDHPETIKKLIPDYTIGCKRVMRSDDYYPVFNRPNVSLEVEQIDSFTINGIRTNAGKEYQFDAVIMATGFEAAEMNFEINIVGLNGKNLRDTWKKTNAECYKGMVTNGFPNLAFVSGPNTISGFNSSLLIMELQSAYILSYISEIEAAGGNSYLDLKAEVQESYMDYLNKKFRGTVWLSGCRSWHHNSGGKNVVIYPGFTSQFKKITRKFNKDEYQVIRHQTKLCQVEP